MADKACKWFVKVDSFTNMVIAGTGRIDAEWNTYHDLDYIDLKGKKRKGDFWECPNYDLVNDLVKETNFSLKLIVCRKKLPGGAVTQIDVKKLFSKKRKLFVKVMMLIAARHPTKFPGRS
ncbi:MAG: hypothetical protein Q8Q46_02560 [Candidatus Giovannonibacteria bacterium]|nr:hypothetical protein [Candidatus Giovannonibacteria bacterium]